LNIGSFRINNSGSGDRQYPPAMMLALLIYCYATGTFSSWRRHRQCLRHFQPSPYANTSGTPNDAPAKLEISIAPT
jgi:hypothetical protein